MTGRSLSASSPAPRIAIGAGLLLALASIAISLALVEAALRLAHFQYHLMPTVQFGWPDPQTIAERYLADPDLFWSLSFAVDPATWGRLGGFCEAYVGYGGEDTDLGRTAIARGTGLGWVGGARAYHQHHPVSSPPVEHLDDILRNGRLFHERWGEWPMTGWLEEFERRGLVRREGGHWTRETEPKETP